ncbi:hypothetical protein [Priestia taiwanensis]|uniref:Uncharacterized protein n=1 Tax=Priestia taiwanensis TaxID=1347902 RepID=A0A917AKP3_9BACI|nr:hypothetical protein [Priestia taiwanensis]MBM7361971.1 hypothetical protein [Priestia taiwanensis]GGE58436.1 hypothetical protein GCM10007140_05980 [Priestia taiwanensis]
MYLVITVYTDGMSPSFQEFQYKKEAVEYVKELEPDSTFEECDNHIRVEIDEWNLAYIYRIGNDKVVISNA